MVTATGAMDTNHGKHSDMPGKTDSGSYTSGIADGIGKAMTEADGKFGISIHAPFNQSLNQSKLPSGVSGW
jgi:hypothetical protein